MRFHSLLALSRRSRATLESACVCSVYKYYISAADVSPIVYGIRRTKAEPAALLSLNMRQRERGCHPQSRMMYIYTYIFALFLFNRTT